VTSGATWIGAMVAAWAGMAMAKAAKPAAATVIVLMVATIRMWLTLLP
jgi:hypothetical protein